MGNGGDEVSIFSQVSSADFHFHRMQLNASFAPLLLFFLFAFCLWQLQKYLQKYLKPR